MENKEKINIDKIKDSIGGIRASIVSKLSELAISFKAISSIGTLPLTPFKVISKFDGEFNSASVKCLALIHKPGVGYVPTVGAVPCNEKGKEKYPDTETYLYLEMQDIPVEELLKILKASLKAANRRPDLYKELSAKLREVRSLLNDNLSSIVSDCNSTIYFVPIRSVRKKRNGGFEERMILGISQSAYQNIHDFEIKYTTGPDKNGIVIKSDDLHFDVLIGDLLSVYDNALNSMAYYRKKEREEVLNKKLADDSAFFRRLENTIKARIVSELLIAVQCNNGMIMIQENSVYLTIENSDEEETFMIRKVSYSKEKGKSEVQISPFELTVPELLHYLEIADYAISAKRQSAKLL